MTLLRDLSDDELRASGRLKWTAVPEDVLPAWVAEMDFAVAEPIADAVIETMRAGGVGYPGPMPELQTATAEFTGRHYGWTVNPEDVISTVSVLDGLTVALQRLVDPGPVMVAVPAYPPFLELPTQTGHELITITPDPEGIERGIEAGARTLIWCNPHNPLAHAWSREELEAIREVVEPAGVHVISDEIHAPLTFPGVPHVAYATVASDGAPLTTLLSATKGFNIPGLPCAQIVCHREEDRTRLASLGPFGMPWATTLARAATIAAYTHADPWLDEVRERIAANDALLRDLVAARLPEARLAEANATYLAWLDASAYAAELTPAASALERGRVMFTTGFGEGSENHVRVNIATSPERVEQIVERLVAAWI